MVEEDTPVAAWWWMTRMVVDDSDGEPDPKSSPSESSEGLARTAAELNTGPDGWRNGWHLEGGADGEDDSNGG